MRMHCETFDEDGACYQRMNKTIPRAITPTQRAINIDSIGVNIEFRRLQNPKILNDPLARPNE